MGTIRSHKNSRGSRTVHYNGKDKLLSSYKGSNGRVKHYDSNGRYAGSTREGQYGRVHHYDKNGVRTGTSYIKPSGAVYHHPSNNKQYDSEAQSCTKTHTDRSGARRPNASRVSSRTTNAAQEDNIGCLIAAGIFIAIIFLIT